MGLVLFSMSEILEDRQNDNRIRYISQINTDINAKPQIIVPKPQIFVPILLPKPQIIVPSHSNTINLLIVCPKHLNRKKRTIEIQIEHTATIKQLTEKAASKINLNSEVFKLCIPNLKPLTKSHLTLSDYGISSGQTLLLKMRIRSDHSESIISIQYKGRQLKLNSDIKYSHTILRLKTMIKDTHSIPIRAQTLFLFDQNAQKVLLRENKMLSDYFAATRCEIYLEVNYAHKIDKKLLPLAKCVDSAGMLPLNMEERGHTIRRLFWSTMYGLKIELVSIYEIEKNVKQNLLIYENILSTITMDDISERERILFHGTSLENIEKIIVNGFNRDYNRRYMYGKGSYFAKDARTAAGYSKKDAESGIYAMLACKVITGKYCLGNSSMVKAPQMYDSLVNDVRNPTIFVINRDYHAVPIYIILYKKSGESS